MTWAKYLFFLSFYKQTETKKYSWQFSIEPNRAFSATHQTSIQCTSLPASKTQTHRAACRIFRWTGLTHGYVGKKFSPHADWCPADPLFWSDSEMLVHCSVRLIKSLYLTYT